MADNLKNRRVWLALLVSLALPSFWNACSETSGSSAVDPLVHKLDGAESFTVVPQEASDAGLNNKNQAVFAACDQQVADILVNVERAPAGESALVSLRGLVLKALADRATNAIHLAVKDSGHLIVDGEGRVRPLALDGGRSGEDARVNIRLDQTYLFAQNQLFHVEIANLETVLRLHPTKGCVLDVQSDHEGSAVSQP